MYLPNSLYERAPHYWLFVGMLLIILGVYLGIQVSSTFTVAGVSLGLLSCAWGVRILLRRTRNPSADEGASSVPAE